MARKFWFVFSEDITPMDEGGQAQGQYIVRRDDPRDTGIFFAEKYARNFAQAVALRNPGKEIIIAESTRGFHAPPPTKITEKTFNEAGEFMPL